MEMQKWAENEIKIYKEKNPINKDDYAEKEFHACIDNAFEAYKILLNNGHSGMSIKIIQKLLNRFIDGMPLTPLTGEDSEWNKVGNLGNDGREMWQNKRCSSVFKVVKDGKVLEITDGESLIRSDVHNEHSFYSSNMPQVIKDQLNSDPIFKMGIKKFPYNPGVAKTIVYTEDFLNYKDKKEFASGSYNYIAYFKAIKVINGKRTNAEMVFHKYFREEPGKWIEISKEEYLKARSEIKDAPEFKEY